MIARTRKDRLRIAAACGEAGSKIESDRDIAMDRSATLIVIESTVVSVWT